MRSPTWAQLWGAWGSWGGYLGPILGYTWAMSGSSWAIWGYLGPSTTPTCTVIHVCPEQMAQQMAQDEPNIAPLWPNMGPRWVQMAQDEPNIASYCGFFKADWFAGSCGFNFFGQFEAMIQVIQYTYTYIIPTCIPSTRWGALTTLTRGHSVVTCPCV